MLVHYSIQEHTFELNIFPNMIVFVSIKVFILFYLWSNTDQTSLKQLFPFFFKQEPTVEMMSAFMISFLLSSLCMGCFSCCLQGPYVWLCPQNFYLLCFSLSYKYFKFSNLFVNAPMLSTCRNVTFSLPVFHFSFSFLHM